jgi:hypothetical protein
VNGSLAQCPPRPRTSLPLLTLLALAVALLLGAAPALAYENWEHGRATESTCNSSGCHVRTTPVNTACLASGCHAAFTTSGGGKCWQCHRPGQDTSGWRTAAACTGTCHLNQNNSESYSATFSHGSSPHLGASGYGKTCTACHGVSVSRSDPGGSPHHNASAGHSPTCVECHNGALAKLPPASHNDGLHTTCAACHDGMSLPTCAGCHVGNPGASGPQITYGNTRTCDDGACHGKIRNHVGTSISAAACITCHASHFEALGTCLKCHADPQSFHHGTAAATPLAACSTCHDGSVAAAPRGHQAYGALCASCHTGMNRPSGDCAVCHVDATTPGAPQVVYTNDLTCGHAACHGKIVGHIGTPINSAVCTACHASHFQALGTCATCHPGPQRFHHGTTGATPLGACAACHNDTIAAAPPAHVGFAADCAACHSGMDRPNGACLACHDKAQGGVPAVVSTNDLTCGDAACHGRVKNHSGTPINAAACATCHAAHYASLGTCATCHPDPRRFHHGTTTATPLAACAGCHDGTVASAKQGHAGLRCAACHSGMARPPVPATCQTCHDAQRFGDGSCTTCHSATGAIGRETVHAVDPAATVSCDRCHQRHYEDLGTCESCHAGYAETHHGTTTLADTVLKLTVTPASVKAGQKARLNGSLRSASAALASQPVLIQARPVKGGRFKDVAIVKTTLGGRFSRVVKARASTEYRVVWRPAGTAVVQQRPAIVTVRLAVRK